MQSETERVLRNLTILSSISHNDKLNTNDDTFSIYVPTVVRGIVRFWYAEKRATNHLKIQEAVRAAIAFIQTTSQELLTEQTTSLSYQHKQKQCKRLYQSLSRCKVGLTNLQQTYRDDTTMHTQLELTMNEIDDFVSIVDTQDCFNYLHIIQTPSPNRLQLLSPNSDSSN
jgi:hypothetical protein